MKKAQAAMEYLMTYGWAILIVIIVAAALVALGVFDPCTWSSPTATGFSVLTIPVGGWSFSSATSEFTLIVENTLGGGEITVTDVDITYAGTTSTTVAPANATLAVGEDQTFTISGGITAPAAGVCYSVGGQITYTSAAGLTGLIDSGTITGRAS